MKNDTVRRCLELIGILTKNPDINDKVKRKRTNKGDTSCSLAGGIPLSQGRSWRSTLDDLIEAIHKLRVKYRVFYDSNLFIKRENRNLYNDSGDINDVKQFIRYGCRVIVGQLVQMMKDPELVGYVINRISSLLELEKAVIVVANIDNYNSLFSLLEFFIGITICNECYNEGIVQEYLLTNYRNHLPLAMFNLIQGIDGLQNYAWFDGDLETFTTRFIIFVTKLPNPEEVGGSTTPTTEGNVKDNLNISKKDLAIHIPFIHGDDEVMEGGEGASDEDEGTYQSLDDEEDEDIINLPISDQLKSKYRSNYLQLWNFLIFDINNKITQIPRKVTLITIEYLPRNVIPFMDNPLILSNLLQQFLNGSDVDLSILSLVALFELVMCGLGEVEIFNEMEGNSSDARAFYKRLYQLIEVDVINSQYSIHFLHLLNTALASSMLPTTLVSHFIKKLVRTSCIVDSDSANSLLTIALRLLQNHHAVCLSLVHVYPTSIRVNSDGLEGIKACDDVIDDLCIQKQLYLWEVSLLVRHFNESVAKICGVYYSDLTDKNVVKFNPRDFIDCSMKTILRINVDDVKRDGNNPFRTHTQNSTKLAANLFETQT